MAGRVPKYGASNADNFTEVFTLASKGGKAGLGDSAFSQEDPPLRNPRAAAGGRGGAPTAVPPRRVSGGPDSYEKDIPEPPPRRSSGAHERESSTRSSQDGGILGSNRPSTRTEQRDQSGRGGRGASSDSTRSGRNSRNVNEDYAGASHLPKFGDWNTGEAGEANYTVMFTAASKERKTGSAGDLSGKPAGKGSGDLYNSSNGHPKKHSPSWWCFS